MGIVHRKTSWLMVSLGLLAAAVAVFVCHVARVESLRSLPVDTDCFVVGAHVGVDRNHAVLYQIDTDRYGFLLFLSGDAFSAQYVFGEWRKSDGVWVMNTSTGCVRLPQSFMWPLPIPLSCSEPSVDYSVMKGFGGFRVRWIMGRQFLLWSEVDKLAFVTTNTILNCAPEPVAAEWIPVDIPLL